MGGVIVLIVLLGIAFAAGYFTRDYISNKRRAEARRWREYAEPDWLPANAANTNEVASAITAVPVVNGETRPDAGPLGDESPRPPRGLRRRPEASSRRPDGAQRNPGPLARHFAPSRIARSLSSGGVSRRPVGSIRATDPACGRLKSIALAKNIPLYRNSVSAYVLPIPAHQEGRSRGRLDREPGLRWTRQRRHEMGRAGRVVPVSPHPACRRTALLAYGKTVWSWPSLLRSSRSKMCASPTGWTASSNSNGEGGQRKVRLPGDHGISRPAIAQGRPSDRHHLYAAVRFFLRVHFAQRTAGARSAPGLPCALLDLRAMRSSKARAKPAARMRTHARHHTRAATHPMSSPALCAIAHEGERSSIPRPQ